MSAPEPHGTGLELCRSTADIVELACDRGRERDLAAIAAGRGLLLPAFGRAATSGAGIVACVRPGRWLLLQPKRAGAPAASEWQEAIGDMGSAIDLSAAFALLLLRGPGAAAFLDRHCRLDLREEAFAAGRAAASTMAQVPIIIMARPRGLLLATPATTSRHFGEWLEAAGRSHALEPARLVPTAELLGD